VDGAPISPLGLAQPWPPGTNTSAGYPPHILLRDRKGGDPSEWPEELRVREFPCAR